MTAERDRNRDILVLALQAIQVAYDSNSFLRLDSAIRAARDLTPTILATRVFKPER